jgi:hypothetical protein
MSKIRVKFLEPNTPFRVMYSVSLPLVWFIIERSIQTSEGEVRNTGNSEGSVNFECPCTVQEF